MAKPFTTFQITVTYVSVGEAKTYVGWFPGATAAEAIVAARAFVNKYVRPQYISAANEVVQLTGV